MKSDIAHHDVKKCSTRQNSVLKAKGKLDAPALAIIQIKSRTQESYQDKSNHNTTIIGLKNTTMTSNLIDKHVQAKERHPQYHYTTTVKGSSMFEHKLSPCYFGSSSPQGPSSSPIPIRSKFPATSESERTFNDECELADYKDYCMYLRLVDGIRKQQSMKENEYLRYLDDITISNIVDTRFRCHQHDTMKYDDCNDDYPNNFYSAQFVSSEDGTESEDDYIFFMED